MSIVLTGFFTIFLNKILNRKKNGLDSNLLIGAKNGLFFSSFLALQYLIVVCYIFDGDEMFQLNLVSIIGDSLRILLFSFMIAFLGYFIGVILGSVLSEVIEIAKGLF